MRCANCERLRSKLSPLEDKVFTDEFLSREPVDWYLTQLKSRQGGPSVAVQLPALFNETFKRAPSVMELTKLGRTMDALGWTRTKRNGLLYFTMDYKEFTETYHVHRNPDRPHHSDEAGH
jgi:hypothetical protein